MPRALVVRTLRPGVLRLGRSSLLLIGLAVACGSSGRSTRLSPGGDATAVLEQALASAGGGTLTIAGSETFVVRGVRVEKANTTLECTGNPAATFQLAPVGAGDGAPIFDVKADGFTIRNCILDGNRAAQPAGGFSDSFQGRVFRAAVKVSGRRQGLTIEKVTFRNAYGAAVATHGVSGITVKDSTFQDGNFEAVFADNAFTLGDSENFLEGFTFTGNKVLNSASGDGRVNANGLMVHQMKKITIEDNEWAGYERNAIKLENCRDGTIARNVIRDGALHNFAGITMQNGGRGLTLADNELTNVGSGIDASLVAGGQYPPDELVGVTIRGNKVRGVADGELADGIRIFGFGPTTSDLTIAGNTIEGAPGHGIQVKQFRTFHADPVFARITIEDNRLTSSGACARWFAGSEVQPADVTDSGNTCD